MVKAIETFDLSFYYFNSQFKLQNVNISIKKGEFVLITGPSGSGKTTLSYCLTGIIPNIICNGEIEGSVHIFGKDTREMTLQDIIRNIGYVFQNPDLQIFGFTVEEDVAFVFENLGLDREEIRKNVERLLKRFDLYDLKEENPKNLSLGQKKKLTIISTLALNPKIIVFDEPFTNLDVKSTLSLYDIMKRLKEDGKTIILIDKTNTIASKIIDKVIYVNSGKVFEVEGKNELDKIRELVV